MKKLLFLPAILLAITLACARPAPEFTKLHTGMSESEVVALLGPPDSVGVSTTERVLNYKSWDRDLDTGTKTNVKTYEVRLVDGKVSSFGEQGNFTK